MEIDEFRDTHSGDRAFLIGNGPSLSHTPLESLDDEITIAMNNVHRIYPETEWRPDYYVNVQSPELIEDPSMEWIDECVRGPMATVALGVPSFFASNKRSLFPDRDNIVYLDKEELYIDTNEMLYRAMEGADIEAFWSHDIGEVVYRRHTSMYVAAQIAAYMGLSDLYFVGCDLYPEFKPFPHALFAGGTDPEAYSLASHPPGKKSKVDFLRREGSPIRSLINGILYKSLRTESAVKLVYRLLESTGRLAGSHFTTGSTESHFIEDYNTRIYTDHGFIQYGINRKFVLAHKVVRAIGDIVGFETYNATLGGQLEVHPRVDLDEVVG